MFGEILDWMLTPLLLLWPPSLALTWLVAQSLANKPFDRALEYNAHALAQQVRIESDGRVGFNQALAAYEVLRTDDADLMYYQISHLDGTWIAGEHDFPSVQRSPSLPPLGQVQLRDDELRGIPIRIAALWIALPLPSGGQVLVQVAETREKRSMLAAEIIKGVMLPQFAILPLAVLLVWLALARGIQPLHRLEERIRARKPEDLSPLADPNKLDSLLSANQLATLSLRDMRMLRNTIYARRGRPFKSVLLQSYFAGMDWYTPDDAYSDAKLTAIDRKNIRLIQSVEKANGGPLSDYEHKVEEGWFFAA